MPRNAKKKILTNLPLNNQMPDFMVDNKTGMPLRLDLAEGILNASIDSYHTTSTASSGPNQTEIYHINTMPLRSFSSPLGPLPGDVPSAHTNINAKTTSEHFKDMGICSAVIAACCVTVLSVAWLCKKFKGSSTRNARRQDGVDMTSFSSSSNTLYPQRFSTASPPPSYIECCASPVSSESSPPSYSEYCASPVSYNPSAQGTTNHGLAALENEEVGHSAEAVAVPSNSRIATNIYVINITTVLQESHEQSPRVSAESSMA